MSVRLLKRAHAFEIKSVDAQTGKFAGYGSVFDVIDSYQDVVLKGAFTESLSEWKKEGKQPKMLWQHRSDEPIGVWDSMVEDDRGLYCEGRILVDAGPTEKRAWEHLKAGSVDGLSIGFYVKSGGVEYDTTAGVAKLKSLDLVEVSVVTFPANEAAQVDAVKSALASPREFERLLQDAGLSRIQAKALMAEGYQAIAQREDDQVDTAEVVETLAALSAAIETLTKQYRGAD